MSETDIAVVGMACRLPGAPDLEGFWRLLHEGREARVELVDEDLLAMGVPPELLADPDYVKAAMILEDIDKFDAGFFGMSPRDAAIFDPQHRIWLEVCWEAFEHAGHAPERFDGRVGVFAGCGMDTYLLHNILTNPDLVERIGMFLIRHTGNDKDFLATRTSYQFDLHGPSVNIVTACSTSLVAIHQAAQSLLAGECEMALAGGVTILVPQDRGYQFKEGEVLSPDGHCRAFDADSKGTIFGSGAGAVVLRRLEDALADGDTIHAVVAGSAVNNDGARKVSYLAPSVDGYAEVVAEALTLADIPADRVQYVEAHGTGTSVGDPIEIEALSQAFRVTTKKKGFCGIGSVKTNIGHLDTAAGVAGFIKTVLSMQHGEMPRSLNYRRPNPLIDFAGSPFVVVGEAREWPRPSGAERIAGVSSLGVGGTNAHIVVREGAAQPEVPAVPYPRRCHLLPVSARVDGAVVEGGRRLAAHLRQAASAALPDIAWTTQVGRRAFPIRAFAVGSTADDLAAGLESADFRASLAEAPDRPPSVVFLFPGGGAQYPGMARELYEHEPRFRDEADACLRAMPPALAGEVRELLFGGLATHEHGDRMQRGGLILSTLFLVEYSLARTLMSFGIEPDAMIGHSLGEYVCATLAGTFDLEQVLQALALRGELLETASDGAVLTVSLPANELHELMGEELSLAAANAPGLSAVAGSVPAIERAEAELTRRGVDFQRLRIGLAAHSHMLDPVLDRYRKGLEGMRLRRPDRQWISNVTGSWADPDRVVDPEYWVEHLRRTVRFEDGVATLLAGGERVFVEVGPGKALTSLVRMHEDARGSTCVVTLPHPSDPRAADECALEAVGRLWQRGVEIDWEAFHGGVARRRVPLPTYAFQRQRYWIEPGSRLGGEGVLRGEPDTVPPIRLPESDWVRAFAFRPKDLGSETRAVSEASWICVGDGRRLAPFVAAVRKSGGRAAVVERAEEEGRRDGVWRLPVGDTQAWGRILDEIVDELGGVQRLLFALPLDESEALPLTQAQLALWQALGRSGLTSDLRVLAVTHGAARVASERMTSPQLGATGAFLRVASVEYDGVVARTVDLGERSLDAETVAMLVREVESDEAAIGIAYRDGRRFVREVVAGVEGSSGADMPWRKGGVYLVTGGLGGIGLILADYLAARCRPKLALVSRRGLPEPRLRDRWCDLRRGDRTARLIRRVQELEQRGAEVEVFAADVRDREAMERVLQGVASRFGPLNGVFHAAGVLDDGLIQMRSPEQVERMLAPKIGGAVVLDELLGDRELDLFVLFASISGVVAIPGQCDYAAANAALDSFASWRDAARPGRTLAVDWGMWQEAGMLAEQGGASNVEPAPRWLGDRRERDDEVEFVRTWSPATDWQIAEHRIHRGDCVMPGTGHLELMLAAVRSVGGDLAVAIEDVEFLSPLAFPGDGGRDVYVVVRERGDGFTVRVQSTEVGDDDLFARVTHARARASRAPDGEGLADVDSWWKVASRPADVRGEQDQRVDFGPRWQCVERVGIGDRVVTAELRLPEPSRGDLGEHPLHPALLDMAFGCGIRLMAAEEPDALFVPAGLERLSVAGRVPGELVSHVVLRDFDRNTRLGTLDVTLASPEGIVVAELAGLRLIGVRGAFASGGTGPVRETHPGREARAPTSGANRPAPRLAAILSRGITGSEGMVALERALRSEQPQVVVSSMDPQRVARWLGKPPERPAARAIIDTPLPADAAAAEEPRDDVERRLAATFGELLGVDEPGLDRDFFELGGHSLLAVRLFARIHQDFGLDLELSNLLTAGTVRKLAVVVRDELGLPEPGSEPERSLPARRGQHIVPIRTEGTRPQLFLVHGAGGNVLGFRELAHYLGDDQPVYGLQARGVDGKQPPHESLVEMATAYLAELREMQPHGPYFLGGYSGGGVVAYEMAQQLVEAGEPVAFVGMIDSWCPQLQRRSKVSRLFIHLARLLRKGPLYPLRILRMKIDRWKSARRAARSRTEEGVMPQALRGEDVQFAFERAFERHRVREYPGKVWLFRSSEKWEMTRYVFDEALGWGPYALGGVESVQCPGDHFTMCTEPNVQILCAAFREAMDRVIEAGGVE